MRRALSVCAGEQTYPRLKRALLRMSPCGATIHIKEFCYEKVLNRNTVCIRRGTDTAAASRTQNREESV